MDQRYCKGNALRENGGICRSFGSHAERPHQDDVQQNIDNCRYSDKVKRAFRISKPFHNRADSIIAKHKYRAAADDLHIIAGVLHGNGRNVQHLKKGLIYKQP